MRIALIDPTSSTPPYDHALAAALARRGHDVHLLTSGFRFGALPPAVGFRRDELLFPLTELLFARAPRSRLRFAARGVDYIPNAVRLLRRVRSLEPDAVHVQWLPLPRSDIVWLRALARAWPTLFTAHNIFPSRSRDLRSWGKALGIVDTVVVHSRSGADALAQFGADVGRIEVVTHPVFPPISPRTTVARDESMLLFFGLIRARKGLDVLIRALPRIVEAVPTARLVVAGDPIDSVEPLRELAATLGVASKIEWRLAFLPENEIAGWMCRASLVVLPYSRGASSGVLATALGYGRPVVVSDVGSLGEIVRDFHAGRIIAPHDERSVASACAELLADPRAWSDAAAGAEEAARVLTWDAAAEAHERAYAEAIETRKLR